MNYSLNQFEADVLKIKPRIFDTYILPGFIMYYAFKSKAPISRNARRALFVSGVYMAYRNYAEYKRLYQELAAKVKSSGEQAV